MGHRRPVFMSGKYIDLFVLMWLALSAFKNVLCPLCIKFNEALTLVLSASC